MRRWTGWYRPVKRLADVGVAAAAALPVLAAVGALSAVAVATHGRPVFFRQERVGLHGRHFTLIKLRTMRTADGATADGATSVGRAFAEVDRLTPFGGFLRRRHLDELPQLLNVLRGDMALVGPRPLAPTHVAEVVAGRRASVRPGFTCYAQLELVEHGYLDKHRQVALDDEYVDRLGPVTDAAILWRTLTAMLGARSGRPPLARHDPAGAGWPADRFPKSPPPA